MSVLSLLTSLVLVVLVYGLSFLPAATLDRSDDEVGLGLSDKVAAEDEIEKRNDNT